MRRLGRMRRVRECPLVLTSRAEGQFFFDARARGDWRRAGQSEMIEVLSHDDGIAEVSPDSSRSDESQQLSMGC